MKTENYPRVAIIGAGFAGLWAAKSFFRKPVKVTVIDRNNYHTFLPLLYQVGAAEIEPEQIAYPVRSLLRKQGNVDYLRDTVREIDYAGKRILCAGGEVPFDYCIIAAGSTTHFFGTAGADRYAFTLKSLDDSMVLRNHILTCFERAAHVADDEARKRLLTFVIVGGGPTGIEFAGALAELIRGPLKKDFRRLDMSALRVVLLEASDRVLSFFSKKTSDYTERLLKKRGVQVVTGGRVKEIDYGKVALADGAVIPTETVVWTAGVRGEEVGGVAGPFSGEKRIKTDDALRVRGQDRCYVAGDLAWLEQKGAPLPMIAPVAVQQGRHAAGNILRQVRGLEPEPFIYKDKGAMVTIGRNAAVARIGKREFNGFWAWILWLVIHLMNLIGFRNKLFVMINWAWDYLVFEKSVRLILPGCCASPDSHHCVMRNCSH